MTCASCGHVNAPGQKFCGECGTALATECPSCGTSNAAGVKFCGECGTSLAGAATPKAAPTPAAAPAAERRLVSVLFADLVGFTTASEGRDAEDTRELLTRYFEHGPHDDRALRRHGREVHRRRGHGRLGRTGRAARTTPSAPSAPRSTWSPRVPDLGSRRCSARAGVLTGEAAVTSGPTGRAWSPAISSTPPRAIQRKPSREPCSSGRRRSARPRRRSRTRTPASTQLKGKAEPVALWRALRVVAARRGGGRAAGLEAPFVGRERELRLVKELFHATADERRAHLHLDRRGARHGQVAPCLGVREVHRRVAGDGVVAPRALSRLRRRASPTGRSRRWSGCALASPRTNLRTSRSRSFRPCSPRSSSMRKSAAFVEPRLAAPARADGSRRRRTARTSSRRGVCSSSGWPTRTPVIMVFEDIHWADAALARVRRVPARLVAQPSDLRHHAGAAGGLGAPSGLGCAPAQLHLAHARAAAGRGDRRAAARARAGPARGRRRSGSGRGQTACRSTRSRPCGCCSTVACSSARRHGYDVAGDLATLDVPETLHALIAARLDGLEPDERRLLQDAAVLGKTFAPRGLAAIGGVDGRRRSSRCSPSLVRKEMLVARHRIRAPRARPVRVRAGADPACRLRDARRGATGRPSTSRRRVSRRRLRESTRTRSPR